MSAEKTLSEITLTFDTRAVSVLAIKKAAYKLIARLAVDLTIVDTAVVCRLIFTPAVSAADAERLVTELKKEALDQSLREELARETEKVRNLILAHAFSKTGLITS